MRIANVTVVLIEPPARLRVWLGGLFFRLGAGVLGCDLEFHGPDAWASRAWRHFWIITNDLDASGRLINAISDKAEQLEAVRSLYTRSGLQQILTDEALRRLAHGWTAGIIMDRFTDVDSIATLLELMEEKVGT